MKPPSPVVMFFVPYRLNAPWPKLPTLRPRNVAPWAWQASSTTTSPWRSAIAPDHVHVGDEPEQVDRADRPRPRRDRGLDRARVDQVRVGLDVDEDRRRAGRTGSR